ncbi:MAG: hypothetical protein H6557_07905 [Lewinellaceae bacterium]|nr:hypothetical protein [Phaeodactylibacter sp.]MCB9036526.1 hypothetical protein [Lewinellaceae bacterium]
MIDKTKRIIIVAWNWNDALESETLNGKNNKWQTEAGDCLIQLDIREKRNWPVIWNTTTEYKGSKIMVFLHNNHPNHLNQEAHQQTSKAFQKVSASFRAILFSGGHEPIYCAHNELGILGINGSFPFRPKILPSKEVVNESDFILDEPNKRINQKHFDFIWNFYWHGRRNRILELSEELRIWSFGYSVQASGKKKGMQEYLQQHTLLWDHLALFTGSTDGKGHAGEYDMQPYLTYLNAKGCVKAAERLIKTQGKIKDLLASAPGTDAEVEKTLSKVYTELVNLFELLPEDTL